VAIYHLPSHLVPAIQLAVDSVFDLIEISVPVGTKAFILATGAIRISIGSLAVEKNTRAIHWPVSTEYPTSWEAEIIRKEVDRQKLSLLLGDICDS